VKSTPVARVGREPVDAWCTDAIAVVTAAVARSRPAIPSASASAKAYRWLSLLLASKTL
jgi:hypothetical protein